MAEDAARTVAPAGSCISCFRAATSTLVVFRGEAQWIIGGLASVGGLPVDRAVRTFTVLAAEELDCAPGALPAGILTIPVRLCRECAARNGVPAAAMSAEADVRAGAPVPTYGQPGISAV
jgi:hypothetical protein